MLLNEFLKEHRRVEEQGRLMAGQQAQIRALAAQIQQVSDRIERSKPAARLVAENQ